jgi:hypothetical protein
MPTTIAAFIPTSSSVQGIPCDPKLSTVDNLALICRDDDVVLAVGGGAGLEHVLRCMVAELGPIMVADGYASLTALGRAALRWVG